MIRTKPSLIQGFSEIRRRGKTDKKDLKSALRQSAVGVIGLREACAFPFTITSGYRDVTHPAEARKSKGGVHTTGIAADIAVSNGVERATIIRNAIELGFNGIGVAKGFIHVDTRSLPQVVWTY